jgi:flavin-dependent dehydrogenase
LERTLGSGNLIDVAIIGGGPAGSATALEARRRGLQAAVWERERFPRDKVCGEFISSESIPLLECEIPDAFARAPFITSAEFISPRGRAKGFQLPLPARGLSRGVMDEALWQAAARAGATMREGDCVKRAVRPSGGRGGWEIETVEGMVEQARALVVACGRWWRIEGLDSPAGEERNNPVGQWLGAKAHFRGMAPRRAVEMFYFPGGYCGLAPVEDGVYNACCLVHRGLASKAHAGATKDFAGWISAVAGHPALDRRLRCATQQSAMVTTAPVRPARRRAAHDGALFVGDAAGFLDPFTGDGISMALHSGRLAAEALAKTLESKTPDLRISSRAYEARLNESVRRSYAVASLLRALVRAPGTVQTAAAAMIPWLGARLLAGTRWRGGREIADGVSGA